LLFYHGIWPINYQILFFFATVARTGLGLQPSQHATSQPRSTLQTEILQKNSSREGIELGTWLVKAYSPPYPYATSLVVFRLGVFLSIIIILMVWHAVSRLVILGPLVRPTTWEVRSTGAHLSGSYRHNLAGSEGGPRAR
jgi:hypothetical protein